MRGALEVPCAPNPARVTDYLLGGSRNLSVDRELGDRMVAVLPDVREVVRTERAFQRRAVRTMVAAGVRQFVDVGSALPGVGSVADITSFRAPGSRLVHVDPDPVGVAHAAQHLAGRDGAVALRADPADPDALFADPQVQRVLDLDRPVGVLLVGALAALPDAADPAAVVARYRDLLPRGSALAVSHLDLECRPAATSALAAVVRSTGGALHPRTRAAVAELLDGFDVLPPGVVGAAAWRPDAPGDVTGGPAGEQVVVALGVLR